MKMSIRWKLILMIGIPLLILYLTVLTIDYYKIKRTAMGHIETYVTTLVARYAERMDGEFKTVAQVAKLTANFLTNLPDVPSQEELERVLRTNVEQNPLIYGAAIAFEPFEYDASVELFSPYVWRAQKNSEEELQMIDIGKEAYDYTKWDWFSIPAGTGDEGWTEPYFDENAGNTVMVTYSVPFFRNGKFWGVATVDINLELLQEWGYEQGVDEVGYAILSHEGRFISHPNKDAIMNVTVFDVAEELGREEIAKLGFRMISGETGIERVENFPEEETSYIVFSPIKSTGWSFSAAVPESDVIETVLAEMGQFSLFMFISLGLLVVILFVQSTRITKHIRKLSSEFGKVATGSLEVDHETKYPNDEIGQLADTFRAMVKALKTYIKALTTETAARETVESELRIARDIQSQLLPQTFPPYPDRREFDLHAVNVPARHVAGDFYDFFFVGEDELVMVIADVSGKGMPAAMLMAVTRTLIRNMTTSEVCPAKILTQVNQTLAGDNQRGLFVTMMLLFFNVKTGRIVYVNAGHPPPLCKKANGEVREFGDVTGPVVGAIEEAVFEPKEAILGKDDALIFFTDGIPEARNPQKEFFGMEKFESFLSNMNGESPAEICDALYQEINDFQAGELSDDVTVVTLKRN